MHQPKTYARIVWEDLRAYFVPSKRVPKLGNGGDLDPQLDWTAGADPSYVRAIEDGMRAFFNDFSVNRAHGGLEFLHDYKGRVRFGAFALTLCTALTLLGLLIGDRRSRLTVFLLGVGGLALLTGPSLSGGYAGRYSVPLTGPLLAAAAVTLLSLWQLERRRRSEDSS